MEKGHKHIARIVIIASVALIAVCFILSMKIIEKYAKDDCFVKIEETTAQASDMFNHTLAQSREQLGIFADILAANESNPLELLYKYMENFCKTQNFSAICIHRKDGSVESYGFHPHDEVALPSFDKEIERLPYISDAYSMGELRSEQYVYIAVPVVRNGEPVASLYGYIPLEVFPTFISSTAYNGRCQFYIIDGNTGDFLMDEYHRFDKDNNEVPLSNAFEVSMDDIEAKPGYSMDEMRHKIRSGEKGYHIFKAQSTGEWYYTYSMPMGINNWSLQLTIDESTSFAAYYDVRTIVFLLMLLVVFFAALIIAVMALENSNVRKQDKENLAKFDLIKDVQHALIGAHNNSEFVYQALKIIGKAIKAETVLLLTFSERLISDVYYWPSMDRNSAMSIAGLDICRKFPVIYDALSSNESIFIDEGFAENKLSESARCIFKALNVSTILLVPIMDSANALKGCIATVNIPGETDRTEMLEYLSSDFFLAIANLESYNIIKNMGAMDYLTGVKNRNSYESEVYSYATMSAENLWCVFIDVNGLHEINNTKGHKAGDLMLCTVADTIKAIFGEQYTYRLGGDEFLAFMPNSSREDFVRYKNRITDELQKKNYFVSVGFEGTQKNENNIFDIEKMVSDAEAIMYREKQKYYEEHNISANREYFALKKSNNL